MFDRFKRSVEETAELDLIPVMNLFMVLIPFLLMGAAFMHVGVVPASLPSHTPSQSSVPKTPKTVSVNLVITPDALELSADSTSLTEEELSSLGASWPKAAAGYDTKSLVAKLKEIKGLYPKSNTMIVMPHEELDYQSLVGILDSTREYKSGKTPKGDDKFEDLFPVVVFSRFLKPKPGEEGLDADGDGEGGNP